MRRIMCCKTSKNYVIDTQGSLYTEREMQMAGNVPRVERERHAGSWIWGAALWNLPISELQLLREASSLCIFSLRHS